MKISSTCKSRIFKVAHQLKSKGLTLSEALTIAWAKFKANYAKTVTFISKKLGEATTRRIAPLSSIGYTPTSNKPQPIKKIATIKCIDLDKLDRGMNPYQCIISFNHYQLVGFTF